MHDALKPRCCQCGKTIGEPDECDDIVTRLYKGLRGVLVCGCCRQGYVDYHQLDWYPELVYELDDETNEIRRVLTLYEEIERLRKIARQMFGCLSLRNLYHAEVPLDGDTIDVYNAWLAEFGESPAPDAARDDDSAQEPAPQHGNLLDPYSPWLTARDDDEYD